jgi:hypothetical protein
MINNLNTALEIDKYLFELEEKPLIMLQEKQEILDFLPNLQITKCVSSLRHNFFKSAYLSLTPADINYLLTPSIKEQVIAWFQLTSELIRCSYV